STDHGLGDGWVFEDLTRHPKAVHTFGGFSHDGERIAFSANRDVAGRFDLHVQKLDETDARLLVRGPGGYYQSIGWSPDDRSLLVVHNKSSFDQDIEVIDVTTGKVRRLTPHE